MGEDVIQPSSMYHRTTVRMSGDLVSRLRISASGAGDISQNKASLRATKKTKGRRRSTQPSKKPGHTKHRRSRNLDRSSRKDQAAQGHRQKSGGLECDPFTVVRSCNCFGSMLFVDAVYGPGGLTKHKHQTLSAATGLP
ncbi:unnamed protein product, partial [Chrysoparadoxa australica]